MNFVVGIASYKRAQKQRTLDYLERLGFPKDRVILAVQTERDKYTYTESGVPGRVGTFLYREAKTAGGNRNTVIDIAGQGQRILLLDDDVKALCRLERGKLRRIESLEEFCDTIDSMFDATEKAGTIGFGVAPIANPFYMSGKDKRRALNIGAFFGLINVDNQRFDPDITIGEDYALCAEIIRRYGACLQFGTYAVDHSYDTAGGCKDARQDKSRVRKDSRKLCLKFPELIEMDGKGNVKQKAVR